MGWPPTSARRYLAVLISLLSNYTEPGAACHIGMGVHGSVGRTSLTFHLAVHQLRPLLYRVTLCDIVISKFLQQEFRMSAYRETSPTVGHTTLSTSPCPLCQGRLHRTWRRPIDRLTSSFLPVQRFRCEYFACQWEGNLPAAREDFVSTEAQFAELESPMKGPSPSSPPWSFVVSTSLALAGLVVCVVLLTTDMPVYPQQAAYTDLSDYALSIAPKLEIGRKGAKLEVDTQRNSQ